MPRRAHATLKLDCPPLHDARCRFARAPRLRLRGRRFIERLGEVQQRDEAAAGAAGAAARRGAVAAAAARVLAERAARAGPQRDLERRAAQAVAPRVQSRDIVRRPLPVRRAAHRRRRRHLAAVEELRRNIAAVRRERRVWRRPFAHGKAEERRAERSARLPLLARVRPRRKGAADGVRVASKRKHARELAAAVQKHQTKNSEQTKEYLGANKRIEANKRNERTWQPPFRSATPVSDHGAPARGASSVAPTSASGAGGGICADQLRTRRRRCRA